MFGATGSTNIDEISAALASANVPVLAYVAVALMFVGLGFKVAAAPFHVWTPDVYEGAPAPVVGFMSTAPKAAAFAVLLRILFETNAPGRFWLIWISAALSMTLGNVGALVQDNVKRLLAYSSIAHAGYLLVAFAARPELGISGRHVLHGFLRRDERRRICGRQPLRERRRALRHAAKTTPAWARRSPMLAATLTFSCCRLIGIPITGGFFAKFYVFSAALQVRTWSGLTIIGVINSAIGAYYYLRMIVVMYMREPQEEVPLLPVSYPLGLAIGLALAATIYLGVLPDRVLGYVQESGKQLVQRENLPSQANGPLLSGPPK